MLLCYSQACQNTKKLINQTNNSKTHGITTKTINLSCKKRSPLLTSVVFNQDPFRYGTVIKLVLIPTEGGTRSYVITISFKVNECGRYKLESEHYYGAR